MNSAPLLLVPLATLAFLSAQPSKKPVAEVPVETNPAELSSADIAAVLNRPEVRGMVDQLKQASELLDEPDQAGHRTREHAHVHEQGLHTGHLSAPENLSVPEGNFSAARGLTTEDEWEEMFPRYALKRIGAP